MGFKIQSSEKENVGVVTIEGDVGFEKNVVISGSVRIKNPQKSRAIIEAGTVIDQNLKF